MTLAVINILISCNMEPCYVHNELRLVLCGPKECAGKMVLCNYSKSTFSWGGGVGSFKRLLIDDTSNDHNIHLPTNTTNRGI